MPSIDSTNSLIKGIQNGIVVRRCYVREQISDWVEILQWLSTWMLLDHHDVVLMGCPPPVDKESELPLLKNGEKYSVRIEGISEITNTFYTN